jgi:predicted N-acetyltransferase YhbS
MGEVTPLSKKSGQPVTAPAPFNAQFHDVSRFECGKAPLTDWIRLRAATSEGRTARTYVICDGRSVIGYYCISTGSIAHAEVTAKLRKDTPNPIPVMILGRLAVDTEYKGEGLGAALLRDALRRMVGASQTIGARAVLVHSLDQEALGFYLAQGFRQSPTNELTVWLPLEEIIANL